MGPNEERETATKKAFHQRTDKASSTTQSDHHQHVKWGILNKLKRKRYHNLCRPVSDNLQGGVGEEVQVAGGDSLKSKYFVFLQAWDLNIRLFAPTPKS